MIEPTRGCVSDFWTGPVGLDWTHWPNSGPSSWATRAIATEGAGEGFRSARSLTDDVSPH
jgi:hypothetical protein